VARLVRDDVTWQDWLAWRRRAHGADSGVVSRLAEQLSDWPDAIRLVASDPEQHEDPWWIEGQQPEPQPWLALVRSLWVDPDEIVELSADSAWMREGLRAITRWMLDRPHRDDVVSQCRARLASLTTIDLTHFAAAPRDLESWLQQLAPVDRLDFGGPAARARTIDALIETHAPTLGGLDFNGVGIGFAGLRRLSRWPAGGRLRYLGLRDAAVDLAMFERLEFPWLQHLVTLDLTGARDSARRFAWLAVPRLTTLSLHGVPLAGQSQVLFAEARMPRLEALRLSATGTTVEGLTALLGAPWSHSLTCLDVRDNALPDEALDVLDGGRASRWHQLILSGNRFSPTALTRFIERHGLVTQRPGVYLRPEGPAG
jgi:hypothetical protein